MESVEIERKFLVREPPADLGGCASDRIEQGYVALDGDGGVLAGLVVAEVEFDSESESDAFRPPDWFGEEVTGEERYANRTLACEGWPKAPPVFRLGSGERLSDGLRRIVRARLDGAIGGLHAAGGDALDEAVHEARQSLKRVRATLRLARD